MKTKELIKYFGGAKKTADAFGVSRQSVYLWGEYPPMGRQYAAEVNTKGKLTAEPCESYTKMQSIKIEKALANS